MSVRRLVWLGLATAVTVWIVVPAGAVAPRFFPDDPIARDPEPQDATTIKPRHVSQGTDMIGVITGRGGRRQRALNVNTVDEAPDSSWYVNRPGTMTIDDIVRGPFRDPGPAGGTWTILRGESDGAVPRLEARDAGGTRYTLRFDMASHPEMVTGADAISTRLVYALGYHTAQNHLTHVGRENLVIGEGAPVTDGNGRRRLMTPTDLTILLGKAARDADGRYRAIASRLPDGADLGPFKFSGVRRDDPNDIFPHEHRRELRGLRVVSAWLNHDDSQALDTRDVLVDDGGRRIVRHMLIDFGSTLGSGSAQPAPMRAANEYLWVARSKLLTTLTFGFWVRPWTKVQYPDLPSVGRFEAASFDPERWAPRYRNAAFDRVRPDDEFWAARRIVSISDDAIRAVVGTAEYSDPRAAEYMAQTLIARRDKIGRVWLNSLLPLADCQLATSGTLTCANVAVDAKASSPADEYRIRWHRFDNQADRAEPFGEEAVAREPRFSPPPGLLDAGEFVMAEIRSRHAQHEGWAAPIKVYFRRTANGWRTVGLERSMPPARS